jgi:hypothetical protein
MARGQAWPSNPEQQREMISKHHFHGDSLATGVTDPQAFRSCRVEDLLSSAGKRRQSLGLMNVAPDLRV